MRGFCFGKVVLFDIYIHSTYWLGRVQFKAKVSLSESYNGAITFNLSLDSVCCVVVPLILDVTRPMDAPAGVTQEQGHTGFLHVPSALLVLIFLARRIQPFLSLVDREVEFSVLTN